MSLKTSLLNRFRRFLTSELIDRKLAKWLENHPNSYFIRRTVPGPTLYSETARRRARRFEIEFDLEINDYPDWSLYFFNENDSSRGLLKFVKSGDLAIDIGGNIGQTALWMANKVGPDGIVISFEPFPRSIKKFERNLALNRPLNNITLVRAGLGAVSATLPIEENGKNSGANRVRPGSVSNDKSITEVEITTLDKYLSENFVGRAVSFIKIDVEGFEMSVLNGARHTISRWAPALVVEVNDKNLREQGSSAEELLTFLRDFAYSITDVTTGKDLSVDGNVHWHTDLFCTREKQPSVV